MSENRFPVRVELEEAYYHPNQRHPRMLEHYIQTTTLPDAEHAKVSLMIINEYEKALRKGKRLPPDWPNVNLEQMSEMWKEWGPEQRGFFTVMLPDWSGTVAQLCWLVNKESK